MKIRPVGAELFAWGQTDRHDEPNGRFSQFLRTRLKKKIFHGVWESHFLLILLLQSVFFCTPLSRSVNYVWQSDHRVCNLHMK